MRAHIKINGQVQGVFFRRSAKIKADELGIVGWVKNCDDGSVEVMAQAEKKQVDQFIKWCKKGPPFAEVESVGVDFRPDENFPDFSVHD
ncbi:MAG: Acylphosphatase [Candidatus Curtissbacteria bacterium GW2011_GWA1_40_16]|uniref:acylphosphatase n=1 Tax=Candidatus Curtissbacteria bacterium GW2011_GWA1_40_16 TaxID=1618405 RepID=A0A0G0UJ08_9BACT|nr:MAG: Acylphosphatase [Candidatus Curtissbacteria bacterium GW2011_GWA1_40_16]